MYKAIGGANHILTYASFDYRAATPLPSTAFDNLLAAGSIVLMFDSIEILRSLSSPLALMVVACLVATKREIGDDTLEIRYPSCFGRNDIGERERRLDK